MEYNGKKYSGKNVNKIIFQERQKIIEINIYNKIRNLRFITVNGVDLYRALDVKNIIDPVIDEVENHQIKNGTMIKYKIRNLRFEVVNGGVDLYRALDVKKIIEDAINYYERKIFF